MRRLLLANLLLLLLAGCTEPMPALAYNHVEVARTARTEPTGYNPRMVKTYEAIIETEAGGESLEGQTAVAEVLRNRQWSLQGFAGIKRHDLKQFLARQDVQTVDRARTALLRARAGSRVACGATCFENVRAFGVPAWSRGMKVVYRCGHHVFFR